MTARAAASFAWSICGLTTIFVAFGLVVLEGITTDPAEVNFGSRIGKGFAAATMIACAVVGAVVASRRSRHPIGWLLCAGAVVGGAWFLVDGYAVLALVERPGLLPGGEASAWLANWLWVLTWGLVASFLFLLFPDGRLPSRRWRPVAVATLLACAACAVALSLAPGGLTLYPFQTNPFGVSGVVGDALRDALLPVVLLVRALSVVAAGSLLLRLRRAEGEERQQVKWLALACAVAAGLALVATLLQPWGRRLWLEDLAILTGIGIPVSAGIAILRYRLYEIDRIVSRTVAYALITAVLGGLYVLGVLVLGQLFAPLAPDSQLAVAGSTLAVAAAFRPVRRRVQETVDRRFNRSRYDAARSVAAFGAQLRDSLELDQLSSQLVGVVRETVQPARVSLRLREDLR